jgi:hypothetical protein
MYMQVLTWSRGINCWQLSSAATLHCGADLSEARINDSDSYHWSKLKKSCCKTFLQGCPVLAAELDHDTACAWLQGHDESVPDLSQARVLWMTTSIKPGTQSASSISTAWTLPQSLLWLRTANVVSATELWLLQCLVPYAEIIHLGVGLLMHVLNYS